MVPYTGTSQQTLGYPRGAIQQVILRLRRLQAEVEYQDGPGSALRQASHQAAGVKYVA